ncbi:hypothetical protein Dsin_005166 [Dipteronia sinensis]|uniref:Uncharacterized protein n=1 Tax=Dipteronia sinensis TaxID=43782 RepID=A0AAE0AXE4_9ROSI|nr:hypothetical protein Dsin_005166 [Dipteronia sinensis]
MCSETSPRISFSHDLRQADDIVPVEQNESRRDTMLLESNSDFEFIITSTSFDQQSCSADELFKNGVILPVQVQKLTPPPPPTVFSSLPPRPNSNDHQLMVVNSDQEKPQSKSFWGFKRSSSLNCDVKKSLICSLPLLSRSNSTGSSVTSKRASLKESNSKQSSQKQPLMVKWSNGYNQTQSQQKPPLKKGYYGNGGVKVSPVLNVPPPYISRGTANLFGLGSLLRSGKDNKKNKK